MDSIYTVLILGLFIGISSGENWDYARRGPDVWRNDFKTCAGMRQSPINIDPYYVGYDHNLKPFTFHNYNKSYRWNVTHNGHTVVVSKLDPEDISISGSDFNNHFSLLQFHFHWGYNDYQGSEHYIAGEKYSLEMHFVHQNRNKIITVIGVLFNLAETDNPRLNALLNAITHTNDVKNWKEVRLSLNSILPNETELANYYRYNGSLTTPPCTEGVIWNVLKTPMNISAHQVRSNFREPQRLYSRKVTSSFAIPRGAYAKTASEQCAMSSAPRSLTKTTSLTMATAFILASILSLVSTSV